jgi:hypothetical protein
VSFFYPKFWIDFIQFWVKVNVKYFECGWVAFTSFRRRRSLRPLLGRSGCAHLIPASKSYQDRFGGPYLTHFGVEGSPKTLLGRWGCVYLFPALTATKPTSGPAGLYLSHFGVECHPNHFQAGQADYFSFRRQRSPRPLLGRSDKKKRKKLWRLLGFDPIPL